MGIGQVVLRRPGLVIERFELGPFATNCYLVVALGVQGQCVWIVDASFSPSALIERARELVGGVGVGRAGSVGRVEAIVLTHAHVDHIAGVGDVRRALGGVPVWIHEAERGWLGDARVNMSAMMGMPVTAPGPDAVLHHGQELALAGTRWTVLHTPGHSPGGIALHCQEHGVVISGDALFAGSIGRTDFPASDHALLLGSIRDRLLTLPASTLVLPGHGPETTVGEERASNPFVGDGVEGT